MVASGQPRRVYTGREEDLLDLIEVLSPAQRSVIAEAISKKTSSDEARCSTDLTSLEITGFGQHVLVVGHEGVFLRQIEDQASYLITDSFTFLRAMYSREFRWERVIGHSNRSLPDRLTVERKRGAASFDAWINTYNAGGSFKQMASAGFDILEVRAQLDSVMPSIGRLLVAVKPSELSVYVEYVRFPDLRVLHFVKEWKRYGSIEQMLAKHFGQVMADAARIEIVSLN